MFVVSRMDILDSEIDRSVPNGVTTVILTMDSHGTCAIQYKITFPDVDADDPFIVDTFKYVKEGDVKKRPVVILLGWAGCTERHLSKYSQIYSRQSFITLQYTAPTNILFFGGNASKLKIISKRILDILFENNLEEHPLFFHMMSNGGCYVYNNLTSWINSSDKYGKLQIQGCIFDSCPGKQRIQKAVKAFMSTLRINIILKYIFGFGLLLFLVGRMIITSLFPYFRNIERQFVLYEDLVNDQARCPQLFLYSSKDKVILCCDVQEFISRRLKLGVQVSTMCWDDSDHVAHLLAHREAYLKQCDDFVYACLKSTLT